MIATIAGLVAGVVVNVPGPALEAATSDVTVRVASDGTGPFDADNGPGNDAHPQNGVVRTNDVVEYEVAQTIDADGSSGAVVTALLPPGTTATVDVGPCTGTGSPATGVYDSSGAPGGDQRLAICQLPAARGAVTQRAVILARVGTEVPNGTYLDVTVTLDEDGPAAPVIVDAPTVVVSAQPRFNVVAVSPRVTPAASVPGPNGPEPGWTIEYVLGIVADAHRLADDAPAITGLAPLADTIRFEDDLSGVAPTARLASCSPLADTTRGPNSRGGLQRGVANAGTVTCTPTPTGYRVAISGADTATPRFPRTPPGDEDWERFGDAWVFSWTATITVPSSEIEPGDDGVLDTDDDGVLHTANRLTGFDPVGRDGQSNHGSGSEPAADDSAAATLQYRAAPGNVSVQLLGRDPTREVHVGVGFHSAVRMTSYAYEVTAPEQTTCMTFNSTGLRMATIPGDTRPVIVTNPAGDQYVVEYGSIGAPQPSPSRRGCGTSGVWSVDPADPALGGALSSDGFRLGIDRVRVRWDGPIAPNVAHSFLVGVVVTGRPQNLTPPVRPMSTIGIGGFLSIGGTAVAQISLAPKFSAGDLEVLVEALPSSRPDGHHEPAEPITWQIEPSVDVLGSPSTRVRDVTVAAIATSPTAATPIDPAAVTRPPGTAVEFCAACTGEWSTTPPPNPLGVRWRFADVVPNTVLPDLNVTTRSTIRFTGAQSLHVTIRGLDDIGRPNGRNEEALADVRPPTWMLASTTPPDATLAPGAQLRWRMDVRHAAVTRLAQRFDLVDVLPYVGDGRTPATSGPPTFSALALVGVPSSMRTYVTSASPADLDAADGALDGHADPLLPTDPGYVVPGTGVWACELRAVGRPGCPTLAEVTAIRVAGQPSWGAAQLMTWDLVATPVGDLAGDVYTNRFSVRVDPDVQVSPFRAADATITVGDAPAASEAGPSADDAAVSVDVLAADRGRDADLQPATVELVEAPTGGTLTADGTTVWYRPAPGAAGDDAFDYRLCDADGRCEQATVAVDIDALLDSP